MFVESCWERVCRALCVNGYSESSTVDAACESCLENISEGTPWGSWWPLRTCLRQVLPEKLFVEILGELLREDHHRITPGRAAEGESLRKRPRKLLCDKLWLLPGRSVESGSQNILPERRLRSFYGKEIIKGWRNHLCVEWVYSSLVNICPGDWFSHNILAVIDRSLPCVYNELCIDHGLWTTALSDPAGWPYQRHGHGCWAEDGLCAGDTPDGLSGDPHGAVCPNSAWSVQQNACILMDRPQRGVGKRAVWLCFGVIWYLPTNGSPCKKALWESLEANWWWLVRERRNVYCSFG